MDKREIVKALVLFLLICAIIASIFCLMKMCDKSYDQERALELQIKTEALRDLNLEEETDATLKFTGDFERVVWSEWSICLYTLRVGEKLYLVEVQRNEWEIHCVDVKCEIGEEVYND